MKLLNKRKQTILKSIIKKYIESAQPISSKTVLKDFRMSISSATIRNEMVELEEMGFIKQLHISSGRVPIGLGYRYYVDYLINDDDNDYKEKKNIINSFKKQLNKLEDYPKKICELIALKSEYIVLITEEKKINKTIDLIKLINLLNNKILLIIIFDSKKIKDYLINEIYEIKNYDLEILSNILSLFFQKKSNKKNNIYNIFEKKIKDILPKHIEFSKKIFILIKNIIKKEKKSELFINGIKNIFKQPEFKRIELIESFLSILEEKDLIVNILNRKINKKNNEIEIKIGKEIGLKKLNNYSLISSEYKLKNYIKGKIAILGPIRMNYEKNIKLLKMILNFLNKNK